MQISSHTSTTQQTLQTLNANKEAKGDASPVPAQSGDSVNLSEEAKAVSQVSDRSESPVNPYASAILQAINGQLSRDLADNATKEDLQSRFDAGLEGFLQGYGQAMSELEGMAGFSPAIALQIEETQRQVLEGLSQRGEELGLDITAVKDTLAELDAKALQRAEVTTEEPSFTQVQASQERSFAFDLVTAEGDKVSILMGSLRAGEVSRSENMLQASTSQQGRFAFSVEGSLNADELGAINELLGKVNQLSSDFFEGNIQGAFEQAMKLGLDTSQIQQYSLKLSQSSSVSKAQQAYQPEAQLPAGAQKGMASIGQYIQSVRSIEFEAQQMGMDSSTLVKLSAFSAEQQGFDASALKDFLENVALAPKTREN